MKLGITKSVELKERLISLCRKVDLKDMVDDVAPYLLKPEEQDNILLFPEYIKQITF